MAHRPSAWLALILSAALLAWGCSDDEPAASADTDNDTTDAEQDAPVDVGFDTTPDVVEDTPEDTGGTVTCGTATCEPYTIEIPNVISIDLEACCVPDEANTCGVDTSLVSTVAPEIAFEEPCQEQNQPGELDSECPESPDIALPVGGAINLPGCCRPEGQCGYLVDEIEGLNVRVDFGCVESPFEGDTPPSCTPGEPSDMGPDMGGDVGGDVSTDLGGDVEGDVSGSDAN